MATPLASQHYVYIKSRPCGRPFYVGKGSGDRAFRIKGRSPWFKSIVDKHGKEFIKTTILPMVSEEIAYSEEIRLIAYLKALGCKLANITNGGEKPPSWKGRKRSPETIAKRIKTMTGFKHTEETCRNMSLAHVGKPNGRLGKPSPFKGKKYDKDDPSKTGIKVMTDELREKFSKVQLGRKHTAETRRKMSLSKKGKPCSVAGWNLGIKMTDKEKSLLVFKHLQKKTAVLMGSN